jgi:hypothetical protein
LLGDLADKRVLGIALASRNVVAGAAGIDVVDDWGSVTKEWMDKLIASGQIQEMRTMIPGVGVAIAIEAAPSHFSSPLHSRFRVPSSEARHGPDEKHKSPPKYKTCTFEKPILRTRKETVRP